MSKLNNALRRVRVGITMGDPSGIGPEIVAKILAAQVLKRAASFIIIGDKWVFDKCQILKIKNHIFDFFL